MRGTTNFSDAPGKKEKKEFPLLPNGTYKFQIIEIEERTTAKGDPMPVVKLICLEPEHSNNIVYDNIVIPLPTSPSKGIMGRTKHFLHCLGEPHDGPEGNFDWDSDNWAFKGVKAKVKTGIWNDKKRNEIIEYVLDEDLNQIKDMLPPLLDNTPEDLPF